MNQPTNPWISFVCHSNDVLWIVEKQLSVWTRSILEETINGNVE